MFDSVRIVLIPSLSPLPGLELFKKVCGGWWVGGGWVGGWVVLESHFSVLLWAKALVLA